ncbi:MAG: AzlD domain-containing protein [Clostridia bacterium]|nr:AzlD domain-containing protein [Clostridia bacterium]
MSNLGYIFLIALVTYALRVLPLTLIRRPITNRFIRSFLYYVPYVTLAAMTFPAMIHATGNDAAGIAAFAAAIVLALCKQKLLTVAVAACAVAFLVGLI